MPRFFAPPSLRRVDSQVERNFRLFAIEIICFPCAGFSTVAGWVWQNGEHLSQTITNAAAMLWLLFLIIALTVVSKDIPRKFANHMLPWGFIFLITCVFMIVIGQRGTISGFALVVTLSVQALHWIASMVAPAVPIPLDLC